MIDIDQAELGIIMNQVPNRWNSRTAQHELALNHQTLRPCYSPNGQFFGRREERNKHVRAKTAVDFNVKPPKKLYNPYMNEIKHQLGHLVKDSFARRPT